MSDLLSKISFAPDMRLGTMAGDNRAAETDAVSEAQRAEAAAQLMRPGRPAVDVESAKATNKEARVRAALDEIRRGMDRVSNHETNDERAAEVEDRLRAALEILGNRPQGSVGLTEDAGARIVAHADGAIALANELRASSGLPTRGVENPTPRQVNMQDIAAVQQRVREAISALSEVRSEMAGEKQRESAGLINLSGALVGLEAAGLRLSDSAAAAVAADHTRQKILGSVKVAVLAQGNISRELARILL